MSNDFSKGKVWRNIMSQAVPLMLAQMVLLLYNVVDRVYIGHLPGADSMALTGIGLAFPLTTLIAAFTYLFGTGGTPLFSIGRCSICSGPAMPPMCMRTHICASTCWGLPSPCSPQGSTASSTRRAIRRRA